VPSFEHSSLFPIVLPAFFFSQSLAFRRDFAPSSPEGEDRPSVYTLYSFVFAPHVMQLRFVLLPPFVPKFCDP